MFGLCSVALFLPRWLEVEQHADIEVFQRMGLGLSAGKVDVTVRGSTEQKRAHGAFDLPLDLY